MPSGAPLSIDLRLCLSNAGGVAARWDPVLYNL